MSTTEALTSTELLEEFDDDWSTAVALSRFTRGLCRLKPPRGHHVRCLGREAGGSEHGVAEVCVSLRRDRLLIHELRVGPIARWGDFLRTHPVLQGVDFSREPDPWVCGSDVIVRYLIQSPRGVLVNADGRLLDARLEVPAVSRLLTRTLCLGVWLLLHRPPRHGGEALDAQDDLDGLEFVAEAR